MSTKNPRTIAKTSKAAKTVLDSAVEAISYNLSNDFVGEVVDVAHVRHVLASTRWVLFLDLSGPEGRVEKTTNRAFAFLADHAMRCHLDQDTVRQAVKWTGTPSTLSGVKGWELKAQGKVEFVHQETGRRVLLGVLVDVPEGASMMDVADLGVAQGKGKLVDLGEDPAEWDCNSEMYVGFSPA